MDAFMNITINVRSTSAQRQIRAVAREVEYVRQAMERARLAGARFGALSSSNLERYAKNLQWVGRQIEFNFTLPLVLGGVAVGRWALENERAMTRVRKVYNESATTAGGFEDEITALRTSFRLLSDAYGVHQDQVIEIGAAWAQAGANGRALAEATRQTLEVMILGEMEHAEAVEALISIQAQYALSTEELALVMGQLNAIENETAVSFQGLVTAMSRGAGAARAAGVDWREFGAMTAALVPAAGGAAEAGNALRTMISRIMAPTRQARDLMAELGLEVNETAWNSSNFMERLHLLRAEMDGVTTSQQNQIAATVASRWQVNRFNVLLNDLTDSNSRYAKALEVTNDDQAVMNRYQNELREYLTSTPQGFSILTTQIRNLLTEGIQPLLPFFLQVLTVLRDMIKAFVNLPGPVKQVIAVLTGLLIIFGPLLRIVGAFGLVLTRTWKMFIEVAKVIKWFMVPLGALGTAVTTVASGISTVLVGSLLGLGKMLAFVLNPMGIFSKGWATFAKFIAATWAASMKAVMAATSALLTALPGAMAAMRATVAAALYALDTAFLAWAGRMRVAIPAALAAMDAAFFAWMSRMRVAIPAALAALDAAFFAWIARVRTMMATLPLIFGAAIAKVRLVIAAVPAALAALDAAFFAWLGRVGVMMRTLPLIFAAAITKVGLVIKAVPVMLAALDAAFFAWISRVGVMMRTLPLIMGAAMTKAGAIMRAGWAALTALAAAGSRAVVLATTAWWKALPLMIARMWGTIALMFSAGFTGIKVAAATAGKSVLLFVAPWVAAVAAIVAAVVIFRDHIRNAIHFVMNDWRQLPEAVANALRATIQTIAAAARAAYEWLSYFNPFVRHSPSLVESVKAGMAIIAAEYSKLGNLGSVFQGSINALANFRNATRAASEALRRAELSEMLSNILNYSPGAAGPFNAVVASIEQLKGQLVLIQNEYNAQQIVVNRWATELENANSALEEQQNILSTLQNRASSLQGELQSAQERLSALATTPITGMRAMSDAIFENEMAQKRLRLEILKLEEAGDAVDDTRNRMAALQGEIEMLRGRREDLRLAGAGSDILGVFDSQIKTLEQERSALMAATGGGSGGGEIDGLRAQLEELQRQGEILDLENSLRFDPLLRQIEQVTNGMTEMPFDELLRRIKEEQSNVSDLTARWKEAEEAVKAQEQVVAVFTARRDELQATYDVELGKLQQLETAYNAVENQIREMESALRDMAAEAEKAAKAAAGAGASAGGDATRSVEDFRNSVGSFDIPGGSGADLTGGSIEDFNAEMQKMVDDLFPSIDIMGKAREWWDRIFEYGRTAWNNIMGWFSGADASGIGAGIRAGFEDLASWLEGSPLGQWFRNFKDTIGNITEIVSVVVNWLKGPFLGAWNLIRDFVLTVVDNIHEEIGNWLDTLGPLFADAWGNVQAIIEGVVKVIGGIVAGVVWVIHMAWEPLARIIKPIFDLIAEVIRNVMQFIRGIIHTVLALIGGEWGEVWNGILTMADAVWDAIFAVVKAALGIVWGVIKTVLDVIKNTFFTVWNFIYDKVIDPIANAIVTAFKWMSDRASKIFTGIRDFLKTIWNWIKQNIFQPTWNFIYTYVITPFKKAKDGVSSAWSTMRDRLRDVWNWIKQNVIAPIARFLIDRVINPFINVKDRVVANTALVRDKVKQIWQNIREWLGTKVSDIRDTVVGRFQNVKETLAGIWDSIKTTVSSKISGIAGVFKTMVNGVIGGINALIRGWNSLEFRLPSFAGLEIAGRQVLPGWTGPTLGTPNIGYIPKLESGGVFDSPTLALIAESARARPEIVTPEALMRQVFRGELESLAGTGNRELHFHGDLSFPNISDGDDAEDFVRNLESLAGSR